jgi:2-dehydro-3-deoxyglucarate aldolase
MNAFRQLIQSAGSHPPIGTWIASGSPLVAEAICQTGFDWAVIDVAHGAVDGPTIVQLLQTVSSGKLVPVLRVDAAMLPRALDAGAGTVLLPEVHSAEQAREAVAAVRYPPQGRRSVSVFNRASRYGTVPNHLQHANAGVGLIVQLQTPTALQALPAIAEVPGVDALFITPADLAAAFGHDGQIHHPQVLDEMAQAAQRARRAGRPVGAWAPTPEIAAQYRAAGFDFVAVGSDFGFFMRGAQAAVAALRTQDVGAHVHTLHTGTQTRD